MTKLPCAKAHVLCMVYPRPWEENQGWRRHSPGCGFPGQAAEVIAVWSGANHEPSSLGSRLRDCKMGIRELPTVNVKHRKNGIPRAQDMLPSGYSRRIVRREQNKTKLIPQGVSTMTRYPESESCRDLHSLLSDPVPRNLQLQCTCDQH